MLKYHKTKPVILVLAALVKYAGMVAGSLSRLDLILEDQPILEQLRYQQESRDRFWSM